MNIWPCLELLPIKSKKGRKGRFRAYGPISAWHIFMRGTFVTVPEFGTEPIMLRGSGGWFVVALVVLPEQKL